MLNLSFLRIFFNDDLPMSHLEPKCHVFIQLLFLLDLFPLKCEINYEFLRKQHYVVFYNTEITFACVTT